MVGALFLNGVPNVSMVRGLSPVPCSVGGRVRTFRTLRTSHFPQPFSVVEATIPEMRLALEKGRVTSRQIVLQYLPRIAMYEDQLNAAITVNPNALEEADERDRERSGRQGPRAAARHPGGAQGQHPHDRHAARPGRPGLRGLHAALRGHAHEEPPRRRRHHHREDRPDANSRTGWPRACPANYNALGGYGHEPLRSAPRSARGERSTDARC